MRLGSAHRGPSHIGQHLLNYDGTMQQDAQRLLAELSFIEGADANRIGHSILMNAGKPPLFTFSSILGEASEEPNAYGDGSLTHARTSFPIGGFAVWWPHRDAQSVHQNVLDYARIIELGDSYKMREWRLRAVSSNLIAPASALR